MKTSAAFLIPILFMGGVSCGPTTDTLQAPFDITSSTSPGNSAPTGPAKARQQLERFVGFAYESVRGDIAQGRGEYLTSLAVAGGIPTHARTAFQKEMQSLYAVLYDPLLSRKESWTLVVNHAWSAGYGKNDTTQNLSTASGLQANVARRL
ncbi:DUF3015 family protein [Candidatus Nitrospira nitrificans]|uniref:Lipoprotein n=1 Tax=Candidatus Nitrospira nitrificans TaxID=1742973 RepID=A0A0S4LMS4_9BACT|nr:DUF3015 family protein [Candidatus Nitrospira nitrificans]CUS37316.1 conserved hypothetical protein [Candidatus Nitrospira nitrificans]